MIYELLKFAHLVGLALISGGLIGVWMFDLRSRQLIDLPLFAESVRNIAVFYDGVVVPGALLLLVSGTWLIVSYYDGWGFLEIPWLAGMVVLFALEFIEGNTVTRLYFMRLRRLSKDALRQGYVTPELKRARATERIPTFTHFLDIPLLMVIVSLGAIRPNTWTQFMVGVAGALVVATLLTVMIPRLYPWIPKTNSQDSP
jgi:uncharacterized membrane protein